MRTLLCGAVIAATLNAGDDAGVTVTYLLTILESHGKVSGSRSSSIAISRKGVSIGQTIASEEDRIVAVRPSAGGAAEASENRGTV